MWSFQVPAAARAADPQGNPGFLRESEGVTAAEPLAAIPGFSESVVFSGLVNPMVVQFASDGRVFVAEKSGIIKVFDNLSDPSPTVFADLRANVFNNWDRGLLGMALAPTFPSDPSVYVLYTYDHILGDPAPAPRWGTTTSVTDACPTPPGINSAGCLVSGRLSKLTASGNTMTGQEQVLIEDWCQQFPSHSLGTLAFGSDGALYVSGGDGASFGPADYGQLGDPYYPGGNPCKDPGGSSPTPPTAQGGALRSQDIRTPPPPAPPGGGTSYSAAVLAANPTAYWRLGDTGAQAVDAGPNALHGSYVGNPQRGVPGALPGDSNTAVDFPTLADAVTVPDNAQLDLGDGPFSYELWFALDENLGGVDQMLLNRGTGAPNIALNGSTRRLMLTKGGFGGLFSGSTSIAANGIWHHLVITRSAAGAGNTKIYLDGTAETVTAISAATTLANNSEVLTLGRKNLGPVERWGGKADEVAIYRRVLSATEVTNHFNAGGGGPPAAPDPTGLDGAILRVSPATGEGLPSNPNAASADANERRIIAYGMRNPFRFTIRPGTSDIWLGDVGYNTWEEINRIPAPADSVVENFGWPCYEGIPRTGNYDAADLKICEDLYGEGTGAVTNGVYVYNHAASIVTGDGCSTGGSSLSGFAFYPLTGGTYPASYSGALFFADYSRNCIWAMLKGSNGLPDPNQRQVFVVGAAGPVDLKIGPGGDLFYADFNGGTIRRIRSTSAPGQAPTAVIQPTTPTSGAAPLTVGFNGTGSSDPEGGPLTYAWDFTDNGSTDSTSATPSFTYTQPGTYTARLTVTDNQSLTGTTTQLINVSGAPNGPPVPTITTPTSSTTWAVGETIQFSGSALDPEDGTLAASRLSWSLVLQHCPSTCHPHPQDTFSGVASGSFVAPDHDYPSHLDLTLTATDSQGLSASKTVSLDPRTVDLTMASLPAGLQLTIGATTQSAPFTVTVIEGSATTISAPTPQSLSGTIYAFGSWSDGGAQTHVITAGTANATYTATFAPTTGNSYSAAVLASGPAGYWRLGDTGAQAVDAGPNALHGSYVGSPTRGVPGALVGDANTAVDFPALTAAVTVPDNALLDLGDGPFSYELWFALDETLGTTDQMLINRGTNAPNVALDGPTKRLILTKGGFGPLFMGSTVIAANSAWHHLVVTRSAAGAGNTKIYLDGVAQTITVLSGTTTYANNSEVLTFGRKNVGPVERWGGKLDEIAVYRRVLSASEVTSHYNAGIGP